MFKRLCVVFAMLCLMIPLMLPIQASAIQASTRQEGGVFHLTLPGAAVLVVNPLKTISRTPSGTTKSASFEFRALLLQDPDIPNRRLNANNITLQIQGDPDNFEVSRDLGWGGLDTVVTVFNTVTQKNVPLEFHVYWWATSGVYQKDGRFVRDARIEGTLTYLDYTWNLTTLSADAIETNIPHGFGAYLWSSTDPR
jgi:hypothetical protein